MTWAGCLYFRHKTSSGYYDTLSDISFAGQNFRDTAIFIVRKGFRAPSLFKAPTSLSNMDTFLKFLFPCPYFSFLPLLRHFTQFSPLHSVNQSTSSNTPISFKSSYWRHAFPATNHKHLSSNETNQNSIYLFFPVSLHHQEWLLTFITAIFSNRTVEEQKANLCSNMTKS